MECINKRFALNLKRVFIVLFLLIFFVLICLSIQSSLSSLIEQALTNLTKQSASNFLAFFGAFMIILCLILISVAIYLSVLKEKAKREGQTLMNAVKTANIIIISFLEDGFILNFNQYAEEKLGYNADKVIKTLRIYDFLNTKDQLKLGKILDESKNGKIENNFELCLRTQNGESKHILFNLNIIEDKNHIRVYELMGIDITDRVNAEIELFAKHEELSAVYEELAASEEELKDQLDELIKQKIMLQEKDERHNLVVEASNIGIWEWDRATDSYFYSDKWYEIFDSTREELSGKEKDMLDMLVLPEDREIVRTALNEHINKKTPYFECEYRIKTGSGKIKWINSVGKALWDEDGNVIKMAGAITDITAKKEIEEKINKLAYFDTLTGLPNKAQLIEHFNSVKNKKTENIALIYVDLDNFKLINESYGHVIGDKVLIEISKRLTNFLSDRVFISKLGGDDYAILVHDYKSEEALREFVDNLINHLETLGKVDNFSISLSASVGISLYPRDAKNIDELLKNADTALHRATEKKCKYLFFEKEMKDAITERLNLRNSLKAALEKNEFMLYYQPQYRASDKKIVGFEALCRWGNESLGMVPPSKFIPIAEESRLIIPLGDWILEEAIKFLRKIHESGYPDMIMSVNISVIQLIQDNFSEKVLKLIDTYNISPQNLELEITESGMIESVDEALENIMILKKKGVRIALDDFGTGYSSLNYLTELPLDTLKIDKSFIDTIGQAGEKSLLTGSIVEIGRKLGLSIVAEGVETEEQFNYLARRHCERIQGYFFSRPLPEDEVIRLID